jgi:hypothetical protein
MKFRIERLEERIAPGKLQCVCGGGSSHKSHGSSKTKCGGSKVKHGSSKIKIHGSSKVRCSPPPPPSCGN